MLNFAPLFLIVICIDHTYSLHILFLNFFFMQNFDSYAVDVRILFGKCIISYRYIQSIQLDIIIY